MIQSMPGLGTAIRYAFEAAGKTGEKHHTYIVELGGGKVKYEVRGELDGLPEGQYSRVDTQLPPVPRETA